MAIKKLDPKARFKLISEHDDAVIAETKEEIEALVAAGKRARYEEYMDDLDESKLLLKEGVKPSYFIFRCLKNTEVAELQEKYTSVDVVKKTTDIKKITSMFLETYNMACEGVETEGKVEKLSSEEVGLAVAVSVGSMISLFTSLGKHTKKL